MPHSEFREDNTVVYKFAFSPSDVEFEYVCAFCRQPFCIPLNVSWRSVSHGRPIDIVHLRRSHAERVMERNFTVR